MAAAAGDVRDVCVYASKFRVVFPIYTAAGALVASATGLDSERSIDNGTMADCTNEATFITSSNGMYYLDLTPTETTGTSVCVVVKSTEGVPTVLNIPIWRSPAFTTLDSLISSATSTTVTLSVASSSGWYTGCLLQCTNDTPSGVQGQTRKIIDFTGQVFTVDAAWGTNPSSSTNMSVLLPPSVNVSGWNSLTPSVLAADGGPVGVDLRQIVGSGVSTSSAQLGVNVVNAAGTAWGSGAITAASIASNAITSAKIATDAIGAAQIAADAIGSSELAATAVAEISDAVWDKDATAHQTQGTFGQAIGDPGADSDTIFGLANSIKAQTDLIPGTQDGKTFAEHVLLQSSALLGKASGLETTTAVYRSVDDTLDRITATVDANGNRSAVTYDTSSP